MPRSKSKRSSYVPPKPARPKPSPRWVPVTGLSLIAIGVAIIIVSYILPGLLPGGNYTLIVGFVLMGGGLVLLSQWR
ncbi:MAG: cell division protein CrgA [Actinomycetota bacterium]|nr:cell division protein CrgA [Actinomycetota bacterium]